MHFLIWCSLMMIMDLKGRFSQICQMNFSWENSRNLQYCFQLLKGANAILMLPCGIVQVLPTTQGLLDHPRREFCIMLLINQCNHVLLTYNILLSRSSLWIYARLSPIIFFLCFPWHEKSFCSAWSSIFTLKSL